MDNRQRILLAAEHEDRARLIESALQAADHSVVARCQPRDELQPMISRSRPDVVVVEVTQPRSSMMTQWSRLLHANPLPVIVFAERENVSDIRTAVEIGISAYVIDGLQQQRVVPVLQAAIARFEQFKALREQRDEAIERLSERRDIERAKGILMRRRDVAEQVAYEALRKMASERGARLIDVARTILSAEALLMRTYLSE